MFHVINEDDYHLKRLNKLENQSYTACIINFLFSHSSRIDQSKINTKMIKIKSLMKHNSMVLIQEDSIIESLLDEILANLEIQVILKVRFIELTEITNWLLIANKI